MVRKGIYTFHIYNQEVRGAVACQVLNVIFNKTQSQLSLQPMSTTGYQCSYMAITKNKIKKKICTVAKCTSYYLQYYFIHPI